MTYFQRLAFLRDNPPPRDWRTGACMRGECETCSGVLGDGTACECSCGHPHLDDGGDAA